MKIITTACMILSVMVSSISYATDSPDPAHASLSVYFDNDLFTGSDEQYTNGARIAWISKNYERASLPRKVLKAADILRFKKHQDWRFNYGFSVTHLIHTPEDIQSRSLNRSDRPYSAYLGAGFSLHAKRHNVAHSLELALGLVGPGAVGKKAQNGVHEYRNIPTAKGWHHQIKNEPVLNAFWSTKRRYTIEPLSSGAFQSEILPSYGFAAGNMETSANTGCSLRIGWNPPNDFADQKLSPTAYKQQFFYDKDGSPVQISDLGFYVFGGASAKGILQDIFLDGNSFRESHDVKKKNFIGELEAGLGLRWGRFTVSYTRTFTTSRHKYQGDGHGFGSIATTLAF